MAMSGQTSLLRRSLSNASGLSPRKDQNNHSNNSSIDPFAQSNEPSSQRPRLFSAPLEPTASIVAEIAAAFEENRVASPKVPPPSRSWSRRDLPSDKEKVKQLIELFSGRTRQGSTVSRSATDLSVTEKERNKSTVASPGAGRVIGSESSIGGLTRTRRSSPVRSYPEPRRWALRSPMPVKDPSPTPIRDVYSPTLPSTLPSNLTSPQTDVANATRFWERASIDINKGRAGSQSISNGKSLASVGKVIVPVLSEHPSPKQAPQLTTPTSSLTVEPTDREAALAGSRAEPPAVLVPQNTAATRASHSGLSDHVESDKLENIPKVARKYLERVNSSESTVSHHHRRFHHSPSPFFSTSPHEFSRPRAYKLKSPKYVVEPKLRRHHTDSEGSRSHLSPNPEYGPHRDFASPSPKLYAGNLPEWIRNVQPPSFKASHTAHPPRRKSSTNLEDTDQERLQVPSITYSDPDNRVGDTHARSTKDSHGISTAFGSGSTGRLSPGGNSTKTTIMFGTSLTSQPAPPMASHQHVRVHQYGKQNQLKDSKAEANLERLGGGSSLAQQAPLFRRGVSSYSRKADDGADGIFEYDSPGELYTDLGSEATLAELATSIAVGINTNDYISPEPAHYSESNLSRDFHHFVNAPPIGYKPSQIPIQLISKPTVASRAIQRDPRPSSSTILHMPPFLPPDSPNLETTSFRNHKNHASIRRREGSTTGSSLITSTENKLTGFPNNSFRSNGSAAVSIINPCNDSTSLTFSNSRRSSIVRTISESYEEEVLMNYPPSCANNSQCSTSTTTLAQSIRRPLLKRFASLRRKVAKKAEVESNGNNDGAWDERDSFWVRMLEGQWVSDV